MSFAGLMDHTVDLYREVVTRDALGDTLQTWQRQPGPCGPNARPNQDWSGTLQDHGPGEQQGSRRQWFLLLGWEPAERDVLSVISGPEAGALLRIVSVSRPGTRTAAHHLEVNVEVWNGSLT